MATRMIDAQLPGMAFRLRRIATWIGKDETWPARVLGSLGQLNVLIDLIAVGTLCHQPRRQTFTPRWALCWTVKPCLLVANA